MSVVSNVPILRWTVPKINTVDVILTGLNTSLLNSSTLRDWVEWLVS